MLPSGGRGKGVNDAGVDRVAVVVGETVREGNQAQARHQLRAQQNGQPLAVHDVLELGDQNPARFLLANKIFET